MIITIPLWPWQLNWHSTFSSILPWRVIWVLTSPHWLFDSSLICQGINDYIWSWRHDHFFSVSLFYQRSLLSCGFLLYSSPTFHNIYFHCLMFGACLFIFHDATWSPLQHKRLCENSLTRIRSIISRKKHVVYYSNSNIHILSCSYSY